MGPISFVVYADRVKKTTDFIIGRHQTQLRPTEVVLDPANQTHEASLQHKYIKSTQPKQNGAQQRSGSLRMSPEPIRRSN
jgi:hypothetical protein